MSDTPPAPNAIVRHREDLNERLSVVRVAPEGWALPAYEPGQYATLGLPDPEKDGALLKRVYSIASAPGLDHLEFYIQLVKQGDFTTKLWHLHEGEPLWLSPKIAGRFTLADVPADADLVLVATGTGLAPFVSMVRHNAPGEHWARCAIVHGARDVAELGYRAELADLAARPDLCYLPLVTREPEASGWAGLRGRVQSLLQDEAFERASGWPLDPAKAHVFLCGNPDMIDDLEGRLTPLGFEAKRNLHFERYW